MNSTGRTINNRTHFGVELSNIHFSIDSNRLNNGFNVNFETLLFGRSVSRRCITYSSASIIDEQCVVTELVVALDCSLCRFVEIFQINSVRLVELSLTDTFISFFCMRMKDLYRTYSFANKQKTRNSYRRTQSGSSLLSRNQAGTSSFLKLSVSCVSELISKFETMSAQSGNFKSISNSRSVSEVKDSSESNDVSISKQQSQNMALPTVSRKSLEKEKEVSDEKNIDETMKKEIPDKKNIGEIVKEKIVSADGMKESFKPVVTIIALKDRCVSPSRLDPTPITQSTAFKALCMRAKEGIETLPLKYSSLSSKTHLPRKQVSDLRTSKPSSQTSFEGTKPLAVNKIGICKDMELFPNDDLDSPAYDNQYWANKSGKPDAAAIDHGTSTISEKDTSKITENVREASLPSSKIDETGISFTTKQESSEHTTKEEKLREEDENSKSLPSLAEENSKFIKEESTIIQKVISNEKPFKIEPISSEAGKNGNKIDIPVREIDVKSETNKFDLTNIIERDEGEDFKHSEEEKQQSIPIELTSKNREEILNEGIATIVSSFSPHQSSDFDTKETAKLQGADGKQVIEKELDTNNSKDKNDLAFMNNERTSTLTSEIINENTLSPRDTVLQFLKTEASETSVQESESASRDKKLTNIVYDMLIDQETSNSQFHDKIQSKQNLEVKNAHEENITADDIQQSVPNKSRLDSSEEMIKGIAAKPEVTIPYENAISFVTTPTMQRKKIGGSQRLSREERPALREVTHVVDYNSSEDSEECDDKGYTVTEPTERDREQEFLQDRKVTFKIESEDEEEKMEDVVGVEFEEVGNDEVISNKQGSQINVKRQMIDQELVTVSGASQDLIDAKPTKIERRFERMASETIEQNAESTVSTEGEFQRMVSQLSTEEVDEYLQLWDEGGLTPSSELDSRDATVESADMDEEVEAIPQESSWSVSQEQEQRPTDTSEFSPKPPPRTTTKPEPCIDNSVKQPEICQQPDQEDAQDYSIKKKFWEQISSSGEAEVKIAKHPEPTAPPPVPRPRSSIVSSVSLLKSEAESDTETTITTLSDSTIRLKNVQQDALSKHSFTGSSDASDKEEVSETDAAESILPVSVPATVSSAVVESTEEQDKQPLLSSSSDSESEPNLKSKDKPSPAKKSLSLDTEKKSKIPVVATRKTVYERSVSLPTSDLDSSISSVRAKKRYFEAQIKKEMVVDQLMTQLEEESSPEHKSINQKENEKPTADAEAMVSRQIHSHIFSHEMDEQIESLVPESKHILEAEEALVGKPVTVTEVAEVNNKVDARRTVKRTDSTLFEAEIVKLEPVMKETKEESSITLDNVITNNVKNMKNIFENFSEQPSLEKSITEPEEYSSAETKRIFDEQNICNDFIEEKTSTSLSSMPEKLEFGSGDLPNQTSDSMEVHIDKSEIEESEKEKDTEEMLKQEEYSNLVKDKIMLEEDEPIPSITVTLSGKQRTDSYSPADSEDNQSEADIVPEHSSTEEKAQKVLESQLKFAKTSSESREPCVHTPEEHFPDTVWEVPVQQEPETSEQEVAHDIPIESQIIVEKDEEDSLSSDIKQFQSILNKNKISISEEEAREIAEQVVEYIEAKIAEKNIIINDAKVNIGSMNKEVTEYFKQLSTEDVDEKLIESVIAKKQREQIMKASRKDTTTSSMEITDEDLRSSGVDMDISLIDSFPSKLKHLDEKSETDEASG
ncbi:uncharacterized protein LOC111064087 [Nilaparvata lugens]|uniref:uncharacterized protein LOC111064087 n=1 Tax=Nilaparvata lugens TaxID=108931 RepID=UPI00193E9009|nr:uncharacterized protein LOC111064087 [Nilaparvata lugens]